MSLSREAQATVFFVTHSIEEAVYLGDRTYVVLVVPGNDSQGAARCRRRTSRRSEMQRQPEFMEIVFEIRDMVESLEIVDSRGG